MDAQQVLEALKTVMDPELGNNIVDLGMAKNVRVNGSEVEFDLELTTPACPLKHTMQADSEKALKAIGATKVTVNFTSKVRDHKSGQGSDFINPSSFVKIKNIVPVYSTKGGVGKSTVAVNLAVALAGSGASVGLLDLDVYGPSVPRMLRATQRPVMNGKKIVPVNLAGVAMMSVGLLLESPDKPVVWRGPLANSLVKQFFEDVDWPELDYLVVDLPPGTGDVQITFAQNVPITTTVFVTTPQLVALDDTVKGIRMFEMMNVPAGGVVENMAYFKCPHCGEKTNVFPNSDFDVRMKDLGLEVFGRLPIDPVTAESGDMGDPVVNAFPESETAAQFREIAGKVAAAIGRMAC